MRKNEKRGLFQRLLSFLLAAVMVVGYIPATATTAEAASVETKTADNATWDRLQTLYEGDTLHAGKVTVDKSVSAGNESGQVTIENQTFTLADENNFIVNVSQMAQVMALTTEMPTPVDVVFVLDTSNSMSTSNKVDAMVDAANDAIETLLKANDNNRVGVVAFSGTQGGGTSGGAAASVLTPLGHYDGEGETNHLYWVYSNGSEESSSSGGGPNSGGNKEYIRGRGTDSGYRDGTSQGTNIHAGVVLGGQMLAEAEDTTITVNGQSITRMPFLVIMSDGQPSYAVDDTKWYAPDNLTKQQGNLTQAAGIGFLPALSAAYYKGLITEHYYGSNANENNRCYVFTMGLGLNTLDDNSQSLAMMTMDPTNTGSANAYYKDFTNYWNQYVTGSSYSVEVQSNGSNDYTITADSISKTKKYVTGTGLGYTGTFQYNDQYFNADSASDLSSAFTSVVQSIQKQAISSPTHVTTGGDHNFDGYVTFTDVIGEYMEVKDMKGILVGDTFYQGRHVARNIGTNGTDATFDTMLREVIATRITMSDDTVSKEDALPKADALIAASVGATYNGQPTQAYYNEATGEYSNSIVWFGKSYTTDDAFEHGVQYISPAVDDSYEYLTDTANASVIAAAKAAGADTVCRSYFSYGTAETSSGSQTSNPNQEYMYFMIRVERDLNTYQQTVTISAPASLLAVEKVYITENATGTTSTYTAEVEEAAPAHVIYEVGLRSDINEYNVAEIVSSAYTSEAPTEGTGHVNYTDGTYYFFTNDWDRTQASSTYARAMSKATFYAAANNPYYTYQEDTYLRDASGNILKSIPSNGVAYYYRDVYAWSGTATNGKYTATKTQELIQVNVTGASVTTDGALRQDETGIYITAGTYTAAVMSPDGSEEVSKGTNKTQTSPVVAHPVRTGNASDSHYTVYLGNNGVLPLTSKTSKRVSIDKPARGEQAAATITNGDGKVVMVGDTLTYTVEAKNTENTAATVVVTDSVPKGTSFVAGSAKVGDTVVAVEPDANGVLTWDLGTMDPGEIKTVSFQVVVTVDAVVGVDSIKNTATVSVNNSPAYTTNTTNNPPEGKKMVDTSGNAFSDTDKLEVGDTVVFRIRFYNDQDVPATVIVEDTVPAGTTYYSTDFPSNLTISGDKLVWTFENVQPGFSDVLSFSVVVNASVGKNSTISNDAAIKVDNASRVTNRVEQSTAKGNLVLSKTVSGTTADKSFTLNLEESTGLLEGTYTVTRNPAEAATETVTFEAGKTTTGLTIKHGETVTIKDLPAGITIYVTETAANGYAASFTVGNTISSGEGIVKIVEGETAASVAVTNTYSTSSAEVTLRGTKVLDADDAAILNGAAFSFTATPCNDAGNPIANGTALNAEAIINGENTSFEFHTIYINAVTGKNPIYYLIREDAGSADGITYADNQYIAKIVVEDNGEGALVPTVTYKVFESGKTFEAMSTAESVSFSNSYAPLDVSLPLSGTKTLKGRPMSAGEFEFTVTDTATNTVVARGYNAAAGSGEEANITFGSLHYTAADMVNAEGTVATEKTFTYTVAEVNKSADQITYDNKEYTLTVTVKDQNGQLTITSVTVDNVDQDANNVITGVSGLNFTNSFTPKQISLVITADKILSNQSGESATLNAGDFRFQMVGEDQTVTGQNDEANNETGTGVVTFNPLYYTAADIGETYTYTLSEIIPGAAALPNMDYADETFTIEIKITQDTGTDGELKANLVNADGTLTPLERTYKIESAKFINTLYPSSITVPALTAYKTTVDSEGNTVASGTFSFLLQTKNGNGEYETVATIVGPANGTITNFPPLSFTEPGTYTYYLKEAHSGTMHGITHDETVYQIDIVIERSNGQLSHKSTTYTKVEGTGNSTVNESGIPQFNNTYAAKGEFVGLTAKKVLQGRGLNAGEFSFELIRNGETEGIAGSMDANGTITFATLYFDDNDVTQGQTKVLTYQMYEVIPAESEKLPGITYDVNNTNGSYVYIKITNSDGIISAQLVKNAEGEPYTDEEGQQLSPVETGITFTNSYSPINGASIELHMTKVLHGMDMEKKEFDFLLYRYDSNTNAFIDADNDGMYDEGEVIICGSKSENMTPAELRDSATNDKDGNVVFSQNFPANAQQGTFHYVVVEAHGGQTFLSYDSTPHYFTLTVGHDNSGNLTVSVTGEGITEAAGSSASAGKYNTGFVFHNYYTAAGTSVVPDAGKSLVNTKGDKISTMTAGDFEFEVKLVASDVSGTFTAIAETEQTVASRGFNTANGDVVFGAIQYADDPSGNKTVQLIYKISEVKTGISGVEYDLDTYYMLVEVKDPATGQLTVTKQEYYTGYNAETFELTGKLEEGKKPVFTNVYRPLPDTVQFVVTKTLEGRDLKFNEFRFEAKQIDANDNLVENGLYASGGNDVGGAAPSKVTFSNISFDAAGTYYFQITERTELTVPGVSAGTGGFAETEDGFDHKTIYAKVVVSSATKGTLEASNPEYYASLADMIAGQNPITDPTFKNTYKPASTSVTLTALKELSGRDLSAGDFSFTLEGDGFEKQTKQNDANGIVSFDALTFTSVGTYRFKVAEVGTDGEDGYGYAYDETVYIVTVNVSDDTNGQLTASVSYAKEAAAAASTVASENHMIFRNSYTPEPITQDLSAAIGATKSVVDTSGNVVNKLDGFRFHVYDIQNGLVSTGVSDSNGNIKFHKFTFNASGDYVYWIVEVPASDTVDQTADGFDASKLNDPSYDTDSRVWSVNILVRYNGTNEELKDAEGNVIAEPGSLYILADDVRTFEHFQNAVQEAAYNTQGQADEDVPAYVNIFNPDPVTVAVKAAKKLTGRDMKDREFKFVLMDENGLIWAEATNRADGTVAFNLTFDADDMIEAGVVKDSRTFHFVVKEVIPENAVNKVLNGVTYTSASYKFSITVTNENGVLKANGANPASVSVGTFTNSYVASKASATITAQKTLEGAALKADQFTFEVVDSENQVVAEGKNDAAGVVRIEMPAYDKAGVYTYTLREKAGNYAGMVYDDTKYTVTVTVTDDLVGGLHASVAYDASPVFHNVYEGTSVSATIQAEKKMIGRSLKDAEFSFELVDSEGKLAADAAANDADGVVRFEMKYTQPGTYTYTLREKAGTDDKVAYDTNTYKVTVTVTADADGYLTSTVAYDTTDGQPPVFRNVHTPGAVSVTLEGTKTLTGRDMKAEEFKFLIVDSTGKQVGTGTNGADGKIAFTAVAFDTVGKYELTVSEENTGVKGMTYDTATFKVTVEVTDNDGVLSAKVTYPESGIKFANTYRKPDSQITVTLEGTKILTGRDMKDKEFKFQVRDSDGKLVATGTNSADGKITFTEITLETAGKYELTVTEVEGKESTITYDDTKFKVTVEVIDNNGELSAKVTYPENGIKFRNTYEKPESESPDTGDSTPVGLLFVLMGVSLAVLVLLVFLYCRNRKGKYSR